jgi:hypothetical protein
MAKIEGVHSEVNAMGKVEQALEPLGPEERGRVLRWASERFGASLSEGSQGGGPRRAAAQTRTQQTADSQTPEGGADEFYTRANAETESERALVIGYWTQEVRGDGSFDAQTVNSQLKHLGHGVSNITRALDELKSQKPQLVIQIQKSGKSKQSRKRYKVTSAGKTEVKRMLAGTSEE